MKNINPFDVSSIEIYFFILTPNSQIFVSEIFKDSKRIAPRAPRNILILIFPENFSTHYQSGAQLNPGNISI